MNPMMQKSRGVVLRVTKYNDEYVIADVFTESVGSVAFMVRVSRSPRAAVRYTLFRPMAILDMEWAHREVARIQKLRSAQTAVPFDSLPYDPAKSAIALFLAETLTYAVREERGNQPLFEYILSSLEWLDAATGRFANFHLVFLMRLTLFLGCAPNIEAARPGDLFDMRAGCFSSVRPPHGDILVPEDAARLPLLMRMNYGTMHVFRFSGAERSRLLGFITAYYRLHLPVFPELKSLAVLREMYSF